MSDRPDEFAEAAFPAPATDDHAGHRQRVRERFLKVGGDALEDYELLELALQLVIPRRDTKALAKTLLREFGSFSGVFNASEARLERIKGLGPTTVAHLKVIQAVAARFGRDRIDSDKPILSSWSQLIDYCRSQMAFQSIEQFRILFLDKKNRLIADEVQQTGTVDHTPGLSARSDPPQPRTLGHRTDPGAQPPVGRPCPLLRRCADDAGNFRHCQAAGHNPARPHHHRQIRPRLAAGPQATLSWPVPCGRRRSPCRRPGGSSGRQP